MRIPRAIKVPQDDLEGQEQISGLPTGISAAAAQPSIESADAPATLGAPATAGASPEVKIARPNMGPRAIGGLPPASAPLGIDTSRQATDAQAKIDRLNRDTPGFTHIKNPILRKLATVGDAAASAILPMQAALIPGTTLHHRLLINQAEGQRNDALQAAGKQAQTAEQQERTAEMPAKAQLERAQAEKAMRDPKPRNLLHVESDQGHFLVDQDTGQVTPLTYNGQPLMPKSQKPDNLQQQYDEALKGGNFQEAHRLLKEMTDIAGATQKPERPPRQLVAVPQSDGSSKLVEATPGMVLPKGATTVSEFGSQAKPNADEQKRADLVHNLNENLDQLEDIVRRRPDLFGKVAGRLTKAKEWIGSDDQDVAALKGIEDRLGMVQQSSHGMRSAQHVEASAESLLNGFKNGPDAMMRAIADARKSGATFTADVENKTGSSGETVEWVKDASGKPVPKK